MIHEKESDHERTRISSAGHTTTARGGHYKKIEKSHYVGSMFIIKKRS